VIFFDEFELAATFAIIDEPAFGWREGLAIGLKEFLLAATFAVFIFMLAPTSLSVCEPLCELDIARLS